MNDKNTAKEYVCVRVQIVKVTKGIFRYRDEILGKTVVIPDSSRQSEKIFFEIQRMFKKYGVELK